MKKERNKRAIWVSKGCKRLNMHFSKEYRNQSYFIKNIQKDAVLLFYHYIVIKL